ncbi:hypothetical protein SLA2020_528040 [Shorea laevis]
MQACLDILKIPSDAASLPPPRQYGDRSLVSRKHGHKKPPPSPTSLHPQELASAHRQGLAPMHPQAGKPNSSKVKNLNSQISRDNFLGDLPCQSISSQSLHVDQPTSSFKSLSSFLPFLSKIPSFVKPVSRPPFLPLPPPSLLPISVLQPLASQTSPRSTLKTKNAKGILKFFLRLQPTSPFRKSSNSNEGETTSLLEHSKNFTNESTSTPKLRSPPKSTPTVLSLNPSTPLAITLSPKSILASPLPSVGNDQPLVSSQTSFQSNEPERIKMVVAHHQPIGSLASTTGLSL